MEENKRINDLIEEGLKMVLKSRGQEVSANSAHPKRDWAYSISGLSKLFLEITLFNLQCLILPDFFDGRNQAMAIKYDLLE